MGITSLPFRILLSTCKSSIRENKILLLGHSIQDIPTTDPAQVHQKWHQQTPTTATLQPLSLRKIRQITTKHRNRIQITILNYPLMVALKMDLHLHSRV